VGLGDVCVSDSRSGYDRADTVALEYAQAKINANRAEQCSRTVAEWGGGALNVATKPILITSTPPTATGNHRRAFAVNRLAAISDYWALTKPEVNFLNQYIERRFDAQMRRTARRPLAAGRLKPCVVFWFGMTLSAMGSIYLAIAVNLLASVLSVLTLLSYLFLYTPLKRKTPLCVLVGAFAGAAPPLIGWAAASGKLSREAWLLYATLFLWQFPHFMAIAWMYREDYDRAGYLVLPQGQARMRLVNLQTILPLLALFPLSILSASAQHLRILYCVGALLFSLGFLYYGSQFVLHRSRAAARRLLVASIIYLPSLFVLMSVFQE
jgi:protoheme IX farnesyltransferase